MAKRIYQYDKADKFIKAYDSVAEAADAIGLSRTAVSLVANGRNDHAGGYKFSFYPKMQPDDIYGGSDTDAHILNFWRDVMGDKRVDMNARIRASEMMAKAKGMFIDRKEVKDTTEDKTVTINLVPAK